MWQVKTFSFITPVHCECKSTVLQVSTIDSDDFKVVWHPLTAHDL